MEVRRLATFLTACLAAGSAFPVMFTQRMVPKMECAAVGDAWIRIATEGRLYHDLKNLISELIRCDSEWWGKFLMFVILMLVLYIVIAAIVRRIVALKR